jgi:DNA-binding NarL/FixJ family response regulator
MSEERVASAVRRVLVVDDHSIFAELLAVALEGETDFEPVGVATDTVSALRMAEELAPDIVVVDVQLGTEDGLSLATTLKTQRPDICLVVLTAFADTMVLRRATNVGAAAVLAKDGALDDMLKVLRTAGGAPFVVDQRLLSSVVSPPQQRGPQASLTPRELEVLQMLGDGMDARTAARNLGISLNTCRAHIKNVLSKLGAHSQLEAVVTASRAGIIRVKSGAQ